MTPTNKALRTCANWLAYCLKIGWPAKDIPRLESLWWEHHDDRGSLKPAPVFKAAQQAESDPPVTSDCAGAGPLSNGDR